MKDNNKKIIIAIIAVATLIVAIIGATFAFFSASGGSANNAVTANATTLSNLGFTSSHSKIATNLVPVASESPYFARYPGIAASGEHSCLDDLGNQICSIYEFTVTNTASVAQTIYVSFVPSENTFDNMYFVAFNTSIASANYVVATGSSGSGNNFALTPQTTTGNSTLGHQATKLTKNSTSPISMPSLSKSLGVGESITYTILVWLQETGVTQNTEQGGIFKAGVNVTTGGNSTGVTGVMGGSEISYYVYTAKYNGVYPMVTIGEAIPDAVTIYRTAASAMAAFDNQPFYLKHKIVGSNTYSYWCVVGNDGFNSCYDDDYYLESFSSCTGELQYYDDVGITYSCQPFEEIVNGTVTETYVGFVVTPELAANNPGMTAGTYELKGTFDAATLNNNHAIALSAFGNDNCCSVYRFSASVSSSSVEVTNDAWGCTMYSSGSSYCWFAY